MAAERDGCSFAGCTRGPRHFYVDHGVDGGDIELGNLTLLCSRQRHVIHYSGWTVSMIDGRPWFRPQTWGDP